MAGQRSGHVELICGCMFSGKTEELIRRLKRAQYARQRIQIFTHRADTRYGEGLVASHNGQKSQAVAVRRAGEILKKLNPRTTVVAIDEAQFFDKNLVDVVRYLAARRVRVIVAGLDMDFRGEPFGPMPRLMAIATAPVDKLTAICTADNCGQPAMFTQRFVNGRPANYRDPVVMVGAQEVYAPRCAEHHQVRERPWLSKWSPSKKI